LNKRLVRRFGTGIGIAALVYLGLALYADWNELHQALAKFRWSLLLPALGLALSNYVIRFLRWQIYLRHTRVPIGWFLSLRIFFCGLVMSITPGKLGEVLKAYLVKLHTGTPLSRTGPIVVAERVTDVVALFVLISIGSLVYRTGFLAVGISAAVTVALLVGLASPAITRVVLHLVERIPGLRRYGVRVEHAYASMRSLLRPGLLVQATLLGILAWFAECVSFAIILRGFDVSVSVGFATFVYSLSTLVGALLLSPGGLGGTEGSMVVWLRGVDVAKEVAVASTLLVRVATLWFAVLLGAIVLISDRSLTRQTVEASELETS
jgi:uncharacterized protein (TIRG00374 family)